MTLQFLPEARDEFVAAALWYETQEPGLGVRFRDEIHHVTVRIASARICGESVKMAGDV